MLEKLFYPQTMPGKDLLFVYLVYLALAAGSKMSFTDLFHFY